MRVKVVLDYEDSENLAAYVRLLDELCAARRVQPEVRDDDELMYRIDAAFELLSEGEGAIARTMSWRAFPAQVDAVGVRYVESIDPDVAGQHTTPPGQVVDARS